MLSRLRLTIRSARQSLAHYRRRYAATAAGALLASLLLSGSLLTGASVRKSLEAQAADRTGRIEYALETGEGFFPASLAARLGARVKNLAVPALALRGLASRPEGAEAPRRVEVLGVPDSFFTLFPGDGPALSMPPLGKSAFVSPAAARALDLRSGDEIVLQVEKRSLLPLESAAGRSDDRFLSLRLTVVSALPAGRGGSFSLKSDQAGPLTVFVPWELLARTAGLRGKANRLLIEGRDGNRLPLADLNLALKWEMTLADYGLGLRPAPGRGWVELRDDRLFVRPQAEEAARAFDPGARGRLVYFVNRLNGAPYSFAAAVDPSDLPVALKPDEIVVSDWLAADQRLKPGSAVTVAYYALEAGATLVEREARFTVRSVLPQAHPVFDARLTPDFPGLTDAAGCRDWRAGVPLDFTKIRPKDEAFWNAFRAAPKAVIGLERGRALWANRYGGLTSLFLGDRGRFADPSAGLRERLVPARFGFAFVPVREEAAAAVASGVDFTGLFAGLSFFAVASGLLLASFLFSAAVADRRQELGLLRAAGFSRGRVLVRLGLEGAAVAMAGCLAGAVLAPAFTGAMIFLLRTLFQGAVGEAELGFHFSPAHFFAGLAVSFCFSLAVFALALARETARSTVALLSGAVERRARRGRPRRLLRLAVAAAAVGGALYLTLAQQAKGIVPAYFFVSAGLLFSGLLALFDAALILPRRRRTLFPAGPLAQGLAALRANRGRARASALILALGVFLVAAVGANTSSLPADPLRRDSGTGGFALFVETAAPLAENLNDPAARLRLGLADLPAGVRFVPLRVHAGDDSSCLNLNRAQEPEVVGVNPAALAELRAFSFSGTAVRLPAGTSGWRALEGRPLAPGDPIPAVADEAILIWSLGLTLGDAIAIRDEAGAERRMRFDATLANSLFQGSILVSEEEFLRLYPSAGGYARFLVDAPGFSPAARDRLAERLRSGLRRVGAEVTTAEARVFRYNRVANTYLLMFLVLGGLGLLLGIGGFGVFIRLSVATRRGEIALQRTVGIPERSVFRVLLAEQYLVLAAALVAGLLAALVALLPAVLKAVDRLPWAILAGLVLAMAAGGFFWVRRSVRQALRGDLIGVLKNE